jgi:methanethiol S-methyltransferase
MLTDPRMARLISLIRAAMCPPAGAGRIALALIFGTLCHMVFAAGVLPMILAMFFGLSESFGTVPWPMAMLANAALIVQFPLAHSLLLTGRGGRLLARLIAGPQGQTLATTTYAIIASAQLLALFALWTPSGTVWWRAEGGAFWMVSAAYAMQSSEKGDDHGAAQCDVGFAGDRYDWRGRTARDGRRQRNRTNHHRGFHHAA